MSAKPESETQFIADAVRRAADAGVALRIRGSGSKDFYGNEPRGELLDMSGYCGVVDYDPAELMITARAGTTLDEIEELLAGAGQMLPFEPPRFGGGTLGGCVAAGLSGPRRAYAGSVRDFVLGVRLIDGLGNELRFGGRVMKNVAGYDVSRLMVGALGTLGVLTEISLKVLPAKPEMTLQFEVDEASAIDALNRWTSQGLPLSGSCHHARRLCVRFAGSEPVLRRVKNDIGGEEMRDDASYWRATRDQTAEFFTSGAALWRVSVPPRSEPLNAATEQLIEWGGALRWLSGDLDARELRAEVESRGGHATLFRSHRGGDVPVFHPLKPALAALHRQLKRNFDPRGILNPRRMYDF